jgi:hypothetical protein
VVVSVGDCLLGTCENSLLGRFDGVPGVRLRGTTARIAVLVGLVGDQSPGLFDSRYGRSWRRIRRRDEVRGR